ncbi:hypothetical protein KFL_004410010 [Klebsormidium nitens]|uniref:FCP1 homology domain-containing protein n=1 Tax=Klebsormidium nitens TaxID=105231 RepID=A0A1Y1IDA2_KLENI|nr:hypothetical protein KFL_004410010 [Klebsormidium nitens]|eukprot:GAQ88573.1 hypothetical protein KFL_004410010 [Klebsormidium nitens]
MAAVVEDVPRSSESDQHLLQESTSLSGAVVADPLSGANVSTLRNHVGGAYDDVTPVGSPEVVAPETVSSGERLKEPPVSADGLPKKLLILDVNGFLIDTMFKFDKGKPTLREHDGTVNNFLIYNRPHCEDFIKFCLDNFVVGVWSSARRHNVEGLTRYIFGEAVSQLAFIWGQDQCTNTGFMHPENRNKPIFLKELRRVWESPPFSGVYGPSNTLLIDDSAYKALRNPPYTGVFPKTYVADGREQDCLAPGGRIRSFLEGVHVAADVREYVKAHPFGQPGISVGPDCSVEITGEVSARVREETQASFEQFIRKQREQQSTRGSAPSQESAEGLAVGLADGLARGQADGFANRLAEKAAQQVKAGSSSRFEDTYRIEESRKAEWQRANGGQGLWRDPPRHATGEDMDFGNQNGARWQGVESGGVGARSRFSRQFETNGFERNGFRGQNEGRWPEARPSYEAMKGPIDAGWSDGEGATGGVYRERTRSPVGVRRAPETERRPMRNGYPRESGWNAEAGWGGNGWERPRWDTFGLREEGWDSEKLPVDARVTGSAPAQIENGWGQSGWESKASFGYERAGLQEWTGFSHWAGPAPRPGVHRQPEEAQRERTWQANGTGRPPGASFWEPSTSYNRSWEPSTSYNGPPPPGNGFVPSNGFTRNDWGAAPGFDGRRPQDGGLLPFEWQSHGQFPVDGPFSNGVVPLPPFRDYRQVTDPGLNGRGARVQHTYVSQEYKQ